MVPWNSDEDIVTRAENALGPLLQEFSEKEMRQLVQECEYRIREFGTTSVVAQSVLVLADIATEDRALVNLELLVSSMVHPEKRVRHAAVVGLSQAFRKSLPPYLAEEIIENLETYEPRKRLTVSAVDRLRQKATEAIKSRDK